jgi:hypothetical protein
MVGIEFLGSALSSTLIYIWSRKNPDTMLSFLGLLVFRAPYLPWVLLCFTLVMHGTVPKDELCGIVVGHSKLSSPHRCGLYADGCQYGISSMMCIRRFITDIHHSTRRNGGSAFSKGDHSQSRKRPQRMPGLMSISPRHLICLYNKLL